MMQRIRPWLAPPVFPGDEDQTRRASLLNIGLLIGIVFSVAAFNVCP